MGAGLSTQRLSKEDARRLYVEMLDATIPLAWSRSAAVEVVNEAFVKLLADQPWLNDPAKTPAQHAERYISVVLSARRTAARLRRGAEARFVAQHDGSRLGGKSIETQAIEQGDAELAKAIAKERAVEVRRRLREHPLDLAICDLMEKGLTKRIDFVARTGKSVDEVKTSLARIRRIMTSIVAAESGDEKKAAQ
jgi:hypothetical protein